MESELSFNLSTIRHFVPSITTACSGYLFSLLEFTPKFFQIFFRNSFKFSQILVSSKILREGSSFFHVFSWAYHSTDFLRPTLLFFHKRKRVYCTLRMCGASTFAFKFLQINRYVKWSGTWNIFLFLVRWQEFHVFIFILVSLYKLHKFFLILPLKRAFLFFLYE